MHPQFLSHGQRYQLHVLTYERDGVSGDGQQVVHEEQEDGVAQDEGHLERGSVDALRRQQEAEKVHGDEEAAGEQEVHHVHGGTATQSDLMREEEEEETWSETITFCLKSTRSFELFLPVWN